MARATTKSTREKIRIRIRVNQNLLCVEDRAGRAVIATTGTGQGCAL